MANAQLFNQGYNDIYATALGNQSVAKQAAVSNLINSREQHNQGETRKEFYYNNFVPSYNYDSKTHKMTPVIDPKTGSIVSWTVSPIAGSTESTSPVTSETVGLGTSVMSNSGPKPSTEFTSSQVPDFAKPKNQTTTSTTTTSNPATDFTNPVYTGEDWGSWQPEDVTPGTIPVSSTTTTPASKPDELTKDMVSLGLKKGGKVGVGYYEEGGVVYEFMFNFDPKTIKSLGKNKKK